MNIIIGMGSNQDYRKISPVDILENAKIKMREQKIEIVVESKNFESPAFPKNRGPTFVNCVLLAKFFGSPQNLLLELQKIELELGRSRKERWAQRSCDLDILAIDNLILPSITEFNYWANLELEEQMKTAPSNLIIPHPRIQDRAFVLKPLKSISSDWSHPVFKKTADELLDNLLNEDKKFVKEMK